MATTATAHARTTTAAMTTATTTTTAVSTTGTATKSKCGVIATTTIASTQATLTTRTIVTIRTTANATPKLKRETSASMRANAARTTLTAPMTTTGNDRDCIHDGDFNDDQEVLLLACE